QGLVFFVIYYVGFRFTINNFNLMTQGRELAVAGDETDGYDGNVNSSAGKDENEATTLARRYVGAIGGSDNLTGIDAC
ncbi:PTS N-acetyl glucosamine transporter subunit IIABC, partial [Serratia marcescens]|nr:PTS N-acetyl glucosamine transporter subunit IIABC [Serratia marcescens]